MKEVIKDMGIEQGRANIQIIGNGINKNGTSMFFVKEWKSFRAYGF